uniref:Transposase (Putative), gypsy type n=1 Tax=Tanacetum cinerariifolium TaxID=118510 RepID=A0A6L2LH04_TANCI|nr:hypothetical protein [Tanacetum cinerariifolium]
MVKIGSRPRAVHEVPLLTMTVNRVIEMEDSAAATDSSGVPSTIERPPLDFANKAGALDQGIMAQRCRRQRMCQPLVLPRQAKRKSTPAGVSDPDPLSFADPRPRHPADVAQSSQCTTAAGDPESENASFAFAVGSPESIYRPEWAMANGSMLDTPEAYQDLVDHVAPSGVDGVAAATEVRTRGKAAEEVCCSSGSPRQKKPSLRTQDKKLGSTAEVAALQEQVSGEEKLKAAFEEFKRYENSRVEQRCAEMDSRLDPLSIDFDEELYPHMLIAIAGRRWMIGHELRLAIMKCGDSLELRQAFINVMSAGIAKGMSDGLRHGVEHGQAQLSLESIEADTGDDAPQWVRDLLPSSSQLTIPVYLEVRDPVSPWACKEEILLVDAIAANVSRAEKKKKCRIVCRTHGVGFVHHARSDGVPVSVPTVIPQGLSILLADAATQTDTD